MPEIRPSAVISFSSEDKAYPASNLLDPSGFKKWKGEKPGEKSVVIEFQLPKAERITQIDIGNEGSAFIEVLVRRSSGAADNYQCLLVSSSFMSPLDARNRSNLNRVRIFKADKLSKAVAEQKWDRVRIVCSQPFTRTEQYGLSFIRFYSTEEESNSTQPDRDGEKPKATKQGTLGGLLIRNNDDGEDEDEDGGGGRLFSKAMEKKKKDETSGDDEAPAGSSSMASQIRAATKEAEEEIKRTRTDKEEKKTKKESESSEPSSSTARRKRSSEEDEEEPETSKPAPKRQKKEAPPVRPGKNATKRGKSDDEAPSLDTLMRGVEFVLSGYQNPLRARLRDTATDMGAKYRGNWGPGCTHLICAFVATPKYKEVSGKGRIVTDKWILECHKQRRLLPWRDFRLGRAPSPPGSDDEAAPKKRRRPPPAAMHESGDDDDDEDEEEVLPRKDRRAPRQRAAAISDGESASEKSEDSDEELRRKKRERLRRKRGRGGDDSEDEWRPTKGDRREESDSEPDAAIEEDDEEDDEADEDDEEVMPRKKRRDAEPPARAKPMAAARNEHDVEAKPKASPAVKPSPPAPKKKAPAAALSLDSDSDSDGGWAPVRRKAGGSPSPKKKPSPAAAAKSPAKKKMDAREKKDPVDVDDPSRADLPSFLDANTFFLYGKFQDGMERCLRRVIIAYGGKLEPYMTDSVKFVVTASAWDDNFDEALANNSSLLFVRPQWLLQCDQQRRLIPYQKFQVVG